MVHAAMLVSAAPAAEEMPVGQLVQLAALEEQGMLASQLQLEASHSLSNAHAFDAHGELRHFRSPHELIEMHAEARLAAYAKRKAHDLAHLAAELELLDARARFVGMAVRDELPLLRGAPTQMLLDALRSAGFKPGLGATSLLGTTSLAGGSLEGGGGRGEGGGVQLGW